MFEAIINFLLVMREHIFSFVLVLPRYSPFVEYFPRRAHQRVAHCCLTYLRYHVFHVFVYPPCDETDQQLQHDRHEGIHALLFERRSLHIVHNLHQSHLRRMGLRRLEAQAVFDARELVFEHSQLVTGQRASVVASDVPDGLLNVAMRDLTMNVSLLLNAVHCGLHALVNLLANQVVLFILNLRSDLSKILFGEDFGQFSDDVLL